MLSLQNCSVNIGVRFFAFIIFRLLLLLFGNVINHTPTCHSALYFSLINSNYPIVCIHRNQANGISISQRFAGKTRCEEGCGHLQCAGPVPDRQDKQAAVPRWHCNTCCLQHPLSAGCCPSTYISTYSSFCRLKSSLHSIFTHVSRIQYTFSTKLMV